MSKDERAEKRICWLYRNGAAEIHLCEDCDAVHIPVGYRLVDVSPEPCDRCERPSTVTLFWRQPAPSPKVETIAILRESDGAPVAALRPVRCPTCLVTIPDCACRQWEEMNQGAPWGYEWCPVCDGTGENCRDCGHSGLVWAGEQAEVEA